MHNHILNESVDVIYIDPPFFSERNYEVLWGDGYEMRAFEDRWKGGIENYIAWMEQKLRECHRVLKNSGAMYLHCDWYAGHYLKVLMDKIFGESNFRNEIAVKRIRKNVREREKVKKLNVGYEIILFYAKSNSHLIEPPTTQDIKEERWHAFEASGYRTGMDYELFGFKPDIEHHWRWSKERAMQAIKDGVLRPKSKSGKPEYFIPKSEVRLCDTLWDDITSASFKFGYPTEKNERLLERIIEMSSNPKDIVLDPMCGCGTAIAAAHKLKRQWIGIDVSPTACKLMARRMNGIDAIPEVIGLPKSIEEIKSMQPFEFQNWVMEMLTAHPSKVKVGDMGIDGRLIDGTPIQVKHSEHVGRNVIDNFETAIKRENKKKGIVVALSFGKGSFEEVARIKNQEGIEIELKTVEDLVKEE
jgi:adenine specific DNA methylase Mod